MIYLQHIIQNMKKDQKPIEYRSYTDNETGEIHSVPVINHLGKHKDFDMIFYGHFLEILNDLGNKKILILQHILKNRSKSENVFIGTVRDIAKSLNIAFATVQKTLVILEDKQVIKRKTGVIYIDGNLISDGRFKDRIMHVYSSIDDELTPEEEVKRIEREMRRKEFEFKELEKIRNNKICEIEVQKENNIKFSMFEEVSYS